MKRIIGLTTAALMGASVLAAPAVAQTDLDSPATQEPGATTTMPETTTPDTTMPDIDTGTTAAIDGSFDGALAAIGSSAMQSQSFETMTEAETVSVVRIDELEGTDQTLVDDAVSQNQEGIEELRASIEANPAVSSELEAQGVEISSVVGAEVQADGEVIVYVM